MACEALLNMREIDPDFLPDLVRELFGKTAELERDNAILSARVNSIETENETLKAENEALKTKIASLQRDSTNSSKPPSSDGLAKKRGSPKRGSSGRRPGGQKGHIGRARKLAPPEAISETVDHKPDVCEACQRPLPDDAPSTIAERRQVTEIPEITPDIIEHVFHKLRCDCGHETRQAVPNWIMSGCGERLQALMAYLTAEGKLSRRSVQKVLAEAFGTWFSIGAIQNRLEDTSDAIEPVCRELEDALTSQRVTHIDETSYPHNGKLAWLWAFVGATFVFFTIRAGRGSKVLHDVLGSAFDGIIVCDRFSAYVKFQKDRARGLIQFCWAHIIRDVKAIEHVPASGSPGGFSQGVRQRMGAVFRLWHAFKRERLDRAALIKKAKPHMASMRAFLEENLESPSKAVRRFCKGQLAKWNSLFIFITHEGVEPTNNLAERTIRPAVQTRKISYGTRSENGQLLRARLLTVTQTCRMQARSSLDFLLKAIRAKRRRAPTPSLLEQ